MKQTFQGIPVNFPPASVTVAGGGSIPSPGTYWFWLQGRNRQGFNQLSAGTSATVTAGDRIELTIPATCRPTNDGSDIREILVLASTSDDPATAVNIASRSGLDSLPGVIVFSSAEHLAMGMAQLVADVGGLPISPLVGMRRQVEAWSEIREWSGSAWVRCEPQSFSTRIDSIDGAAGARQSLSLVAPSLVQPVAYGVDGSDSITITYWLINDTSVVVPASIGITCTVESIGKDISALINNGVLAMAFAGYVNTATASLDRLNAAGTGDMVGIGDWLDYPGTFTGLVLPKDLLPEMAYCLSFKLNMNEAIARFAAYEGQLIGLRLDLEPYTAHFVPMGLFTGSLIASDAGRRRLVPGGTGLSLLGQPGSGVVKISQSQAYLFRDRPAQVVTGLKGSTAGQQVYVSAQGNLFVSETPGSTSALRAVVGTLNGFGKAIPAGRVGLDGTFRLTVEVPIPAAIRPDYPDLLAGSTQGVFNSTSLRIYAKPTVGGNVLYWDTVIPLDQPMVTLTLSVAGTSLGTASILSTDEAFGLYAPDGVIAGRVAGGSAFVSGNYDIFAAFYYFGAITSISHSTMLGCIPEADGSIADIFDLLKYLAPPVFQFGQLRAIPFEQRLPLRQVFCAIAPGNYRWNPSETTSEDLDFTFREAAGAPGPGELAVDNAEPSLVETIRFNALDRDESPLVLIDEVLIEDKIQIDAAGGADYARFRVLALPVLTDSIYTIQVRYLSGEGSLSDGGLIVLGLGAGFIRPFDIGRSVPGRWVPEIAVGKGGSVMDTDEVLGVFSQVLTLDDEVLVLDGDIVYLK